MSEDRPSVRSSVCPYVRPSVSPLSVCQPGPFVRPLNKEGTAHNESQYWQANSNACNDSGQRRRLIRAERQPQSQGFIRWTVDSGHWTVDSRPWTVDGGHGTSTMGRPSETKQIKSPGRRVAQWLTIDYDRPESPTKVRQQLRLSTSFAVRKIQGSAFGCGRMRGKNIAGPHANR